MKLILDVNEKEFDQIFRSGKVTVYVWNGSKKERVLRNAFKSGKPVSITFSKNTRTNWIKDLPCYVDIPLERIGNAMEAAFILKRKGGEDV